MFVIKINDFVFIISGKYKGIIGVVLNKVFNNYLIIKGVNLLSKSIKSDLKNKINGCFIKKEGIIHISNVSFCDVISRKKYTSRVVRNIIKINKFVKHKSKKN